MSEHMKLFTDEQRVELARLLKESIIFLTKAVDNLELENDLFAGVHIASYKMNDDEVGEIMRTALDAKIEKRENK